MPKKTRGNLVGAWAFLIGVILAVLIGLLGITSNVVLTLLVVLGVIVGLLNIGDEETNTFLLAAVSLVIVSYMGSSALGVISAIGSVLNALMTLFVPATIIVALKSVFSIAKA